MVCLGVAFQHCATQLDLTRQVTKTHAQPYQFESRDRGIGLNAGGLKEGCLIKALI